RFSRSDEWGRALSVTVERVRKFESTPSAAILLGLTQEQVYLFDEGRRSRLFNNRHVACHDAALARDGTRLVCAWSDMTGTTHTLGLNDTGGRLIWERSLDAAANRVAINAAGTLLLAGQADGELLAFDDRRRPLWEWSGGEAITALAI